MKNNGLGYILRYLPRHTADGINDMLIGDSGIFDSVSEIRLRRDMMTTITVDGRNVIVSSDRCTSSDLTQTLARLTEDSVHTYGESLKEGFISLDGGFRIGVCGRASVSGGAINGVYDISSICIRIPHEIRGVCGEVKRICTSPLCGAVIYSPPGIGKTTLLRDLASSMSSGSGAYRVAVIDTRGEIYLPDMFSSSIADFLTGYPRAAGIEIATRTLSPEIIICDEIGSSDEASSILAAQSSGVPLIATAHASSLDELMRRPHIKTLCDAMVFRYAIGISRKRGERRFDISAHELTGGRRG